MDPVRNFISCQTGQPVCWANSANKTNSQTVSQEMNRSTKYLHCCTHCSCTYLYWLWVLIAVYINCTLQLQRLVAHTLCTSGRACVRTRTHGCIALFAHGCTHCMHALYRNEVTQNCSLYTKSAYKTWFCVTCTPRKSYKIVFCIQKVYTKRCFVWLPTCTVRPYVRYAYPCAYRCIHLCVHLYSHVCAHPRSCEHALVWRVLQQV